MIPREVEVSLSHFGAAAARTGVAATPANKERYSETRAALVAAIERAIEAKPAGEFVTRQLHQRMIDGYRRQLSDSVDGHEAALLRAEAAEAERDRVKADLDISVTQHERLYCRIKFAEQSNDRLAAALATAQARVETMRGAIHAMLDEMETDPVGLGMLRATNAARAVMNPATGPGKAPATQKGTGSPASDTGNRGGGASLAAAPSDYEAVCGSTGRPTP